MPRLGALAGESAAGPMLSTLPEISPVAWTTFFTGRAPGDHGIFGFTEFEARGYGIRYNSSAQVRVPYIWDWLGLRGRRSVVLNVPLTYPARPLDGIMISGFIALDYDRAVWPGWVAEELRRTGYRLEADFEKVHQDREAFQADLEEALAGRARLVERFWPGQWDLFVLVVTDTDRLHHFFLREFLEQGPASEFFIKFFRRVDDLVGRILDLTFEMARREDRDVFLVMLSDHGFTPVLEEFHLNRWLAAKGFQEGLGPQARVLALDPTRIYFNRPPRFSQGRVSQAEARTLADEIAAGLASERAAAGVEDGRQLYSGPAADLAPDLVVRPRTGYEFKAKFDPGPIYGPSLLQGTHTREDAFFLVRDFKNPAHELEIGDILDLGQDLFSRFNL